jgi:phosphoglycolate phosphatase
MNRRAVLFDLDGTLVDSLEDIADSMNAVLARLGVPEHPVDAYRYFVGEGMEMLVRRALPDGRDDDTTLTSALLAVRAEYAKRSVRKTRPYPGIPELLDTLAGREIPVAVLSNKPHAPTLDLVGRLLGSWSFAAVLGAGPDRPRKPDPAGAFEIAGELGIAPTEWFYLGDTATDMQTARAAGMGAVGVLWGFRTADELTAAGAELLLPHPLDLLPHIR